MAAAPVASPAPLVAACLKDADHAVRMGFVRKVYGILSAQLLLTVLIASPFQLMTRRAVVESQWLLVLSTVVLLGTMCSLMCCRATLLRKYPQNYCVLFVLTSCMGVVVGFTSAMYTWQSVILSAGITVGIFLGMTAFAWTTKTDFTGYGPYLFAAMMCLCLFGFAISILGFCGVHIRGAILLYDFCAVLLFTFYIVYDTQLIIGGGHQVQFAIDDYCFAALNLYLDIIRLFMHLLRLLGDRK